MSESSQAQPDLPRDPHWWTDEHSSSWERAKVALRRDWEQTKGDLADTGVDLNQGAMDTIRQAVGTQPIPADHLPNPGPRHEWSRLEPALRFGHGAARHYSDSDWNEKIAARLRSEWEASGQRSAWDSVKAGIEHGWHSVRRAL
ncbi:MAG: hypothetical protein ABUL62_26930 [Myxococcales bacterium]